MKGVASIFFFLLPLLLREARCSLHTEPQITQADHLHLRQTRQERELALREGQS